VKKGELNQAVLYNTCVYINVSQNVSIFMNIHIILLCKEKKNLARLFKLQMDITGILDSLYELREIRCSFCC